MGLVAAPVADPGFSCVLLWGTGHLSSARRSRGQYWRSGCRAPFVIVLYARGHDPAVGDDGPALRTAGGSAGRGIVRYSRWHAISGRIRDLRRDGIVPARSGYVARCPVCGLPILLDTHGSSFHCWRHPGCGGRRQIRHCPVYAGCARRRGIGGAAAAPGWCLAGGAAGDALLLADSARRGHRHWWSSVLARYHDQLPWLARRQMSR